MKRRGAIANAHPRLAQEKQVKLRGHVMGADVKRIPENGAAEAQRFYVGAEGREALGDAAEFEIVAFDNQGFGGGKIAAVPCRIGRSKPWASSLMR
jgi:hypothetical protein